MAAVRNQLKTHRSREVGTALALTFAVWALARNPDVGAKVLAEVSGLAGPPTFADLGRLPNTAAVFDETLRRYPPAWAIGRETTAPVKIGDMEIPSGETVWVFPWAMHRDARWWPEPLVFKPERYLEEGARKKPGYLPFGTGPRVCIGAAFAMQQLTVTLATIARFFRLDLAPGHRVVHVHRVTLRPEGGMMMTLRRRH